jgi:hypothetical protein
MDEIIEKGKKDFEEFCQLFKGKTLSEVDAIVKEKNLSYGGANPETEEDMRDINYKSICATVVSEDGVCRVSPDVDIYDGNEEWYSVEIFNS